MSFSLSGSIITQTGTDTDLSGLSGLTGVSTYANVYVLDNVFLRVEGTLSFNGVEERLAFVNPDDSGTGLNYMSIYVDDGGSLTVSCDNGVKAGGFVQTNTLATCIDFGTRAIAGPQGATAYDGGRKFFSVHPNGFVALTGVFIGENSNNQGIISSFDGTSELVDCLMITKTPLSNVQYSFKGTALIRRTTFLGAVLADRGATYTFDGFQVGEASEGFLFGGAAVGNTHTTVVDFATYNTASQDIRINMSGASNYGTVILVDAQKDANNTIVAMTDNDGFNFCVWQSNVTLNFVDTTLSPIDVKVYAQDVDNGNRFGTIVVSGGTDISDSTKTYQGTTSSGSISFAPYTAFSREISGVYTVDNRGNSNGSNITFKFCDYNSLLGSVEPTLVGNGVKTVTSTVLPDALITQQNKSTVDAYSTIDTAPKLYDKAKAHVTDNFAGETQTTVTRSGNSIDCRALNVNIDATASQAFNLSGNTLTIKASDFSDDMTTTGVITLSNGATFSGTRTDANGTIYPNQPINITNLLAGSRLQIYNVTTGLETVNEVVAGTSYVSSYQEGTDYTDGDTVRIRVTKLGQEEWTGTVIDTSAGFNVLVGQVYSQIYAAMGVDGSTVTKLQADYVNKEIDLIVAVDWTMAEVYAWWMYNLTTEDGIRHFFGGITAIDEANFKINTATVDLWLNNNTSASYKQTDNRRFFRDTTDPYPVRTPTASGYGLDVVWRSTILIAETDTSGLTPAESTKLFGLPDTSGLTVAENTKLFGLPDTSGLTVAENAKLFGLPTEDTIIQAQKDAIY